LSMAADDIVQSFPGLRDAGYRVTSPESGEYNCVAWATGDVEHWWDPTPGGGYYWPEQVPRTLSLPNLISALAAVGFEETDSLDLEPGHEKAALYADDHGWPTHVARQLPSGAWTSKLGVGEDIEHTTVQALEGSIYGKVVRVLRRVRPESGAS
jgi:hypothetical protein